MSARFEAVAAIRAKYAARLAVATLGADQHQHRREISVCDEILAVLATEPNATAAVDATLDVTAELARVTAELERMRVNFSAQVDDTLNVIQLLSKAEAETKERQAALEVALEERMSALAERNEARECEEIERARAKKAEKANAALRAVLKDDRAYEVTLCAYCAYCKAAQLKCENGCFEREREWCDQVHAALADPSLGADWVPRTELRRVAEEAWNRGYGRGKVFEVGTRAGDLDAIVRGGK